MVAVSQFLESPGQLAWLDELETSNGEEPIIGNGPGLIEERNSRRVFEIELHASDREADPHG
jgi:hypothetical protein